MTAEESGFRIVDDRAVHHWHVFTLLRRLIEAPDGGRHERTFVESPGAVGVVAIDGRGRVVLVEQYRPALDGPLLEIPAGMRDVPGEPPEITAKRELLEEVGIVANSWSHLGAIVGAAAVTNSRVEIYLANELSTASRAPHGPEEEAMVIRWVPLSEAVEMVETGVIVDAKSSVGILLAARSLGI